MVNTGHPSRGCDPCKARHTKCDERRPQCSRCLKAGRQCTGYKSDFDTRLRNETVNVSRRNRARHDGSIQYLTPSLPVPYEPQAVALFLDNFVLDSPESRSSRGFLSGLSPLLRAAEPDSLLSVTADAVGLCFLARSAANRSMASRAARSYLRSLTRLQTALCHSSDSISTETMISVYLMGLYEIMMPPEKTVHPWLAHLGGLTAIRKARYKKTRRSFSDIGIFATLDNSPDKSTQFATYDTSIDEWFISNSTHNQRLLDSMFFTLHGSEPPPLTEKRPTDDPFNDLILRTQTILQPEPSLFETNCPRAKERIEKLLVAARSQLLSFREWPLRMPDCWHPTMIQRADLEGADLSQVDIYPSRIDVYPSLYIAAVWNTYRTTLLRLCDLIVQCGQYLETARRRFQETSEYQALCVEAQKTAEDICCSVAYHINIDWVNRIAGSDLPKSPRALGGLFLIWPLYGGSILSIVPNEHRAWMRCQLRSIGTSMGLAQASVLADTVDLWKKTDPNKTLVITQGHVFMWSASMF